MKFDKVLNELRNVPKTKKKAAAKKREKTWKEKYGADLKDIEKTAKKLEKHPEFDEPFALAVYLKSPHMKPRRKEAAKKAATTRKKNK